MSEWTIPTYLPTCYDIVDVWTICLIRDSRVCVLLLLLLLLCLLPNAFSYLTKFQHFDENFKRIIITEWTKVNDKILFLMYINCVIPTCIVDQLIEQQNHVIKQNFFLAKALQFQRQFRGKTNLVTNAFFIIRKPSSSTFFVSFSTLLYPRDLV